MKFMINDSWFMIHDIRIHDIKNLFWDFFTCTNLHSLEISKPKSLLSEWTAVCQMEIIQKTIIGSVQVLHQHIFQDSETRKSWYGAWKKHGTGLTVLVGTGLESVWQVSKFLN